MRTKKWINVLAFVAVIAGNALANLLRLGGNTTGEVSEQYLNLFTPAPVTFGIWGVIYLLLAVFVIYQWNADGLRERVGWWFAASCAMNVAWIFAWHNESLGLSVLLIAGLLLTLGVIEKRIGMPHGGPLANTLSYAAFDLYYGWIIAATIANVATWLTQIGWNGFGLPESIWTVMLLLVGAAIAIAVVLLQGKWLSAAAVAWAYFGIMLRHLSDTGFAGMYPAVLFTAAGCILLILTAILVSRSRFAVPLRRPSA